MDNHFCLPDYKYTYHWEDIARENTSRMSTPFSMNWENYWIRELGSLLGSLSPVMCFL